jgi:hypothetical protein
MSFNESAHLSALEALHRKWRKGLFHILAKSAVRQSCSCSHHDHVGKRSIQGSKAFVSLVFPLVLYLTASRRRSAFSGSSSGF